MLPENTGTAAGTATGSNISAVTTSLAASVGSGGAAVQGGGVDGGGGALPVAQPAQETSKDEEETWTDEGGEEEAPGGKVVHEAPSEVNGAAQTEDEASGGEAEAEEVSTGPEEEALNSADERSPESEEDVADVETETDEAQTSEREPQYVNTAAYGEMLEGLATRMSDQIDKSVSNAAEEALVQGERYRESMRRLHTELGHFQAGVAHLGHIAYHRQKEHAQRIKVAMSLNQKAGGAA